MCVGSFAWRVFEMNSSGCEKSYLDSLSPARWSGWQSGKPIGMSLAKQEGNQGDNVVCYLPMHEGVERSLMAFGEYVDGLHTVALIPE